ncbi:MAG: YdeI/OmpD-associated family protein [Nanoarchaeota archaeon]
MIKGKGKVNSKKSGESLHKMPTDLQKVIVAFPAVKAKWEDITPLARNEWICWIESAKKAETREKKLERICEDLLNGKRRPCCWPGCNHR